MKPGNHLQQCEKGAKSCGLYREMRISEERNHALGYECIFNVQMFRKEELNEQIFIYIRIGNRGSSRQNL